MLRTLYNVLCNRDSVHNAERGVGGAAGPQGPDGAGLPWQAGLGPPAGGGAQEGPRTSPGVAQLGLQLARGAGAAHSTVVTGQSPC